MVDPGPEYVPCRWGPPRLCGSPFSHTIFPPCNAGACVFFAQSQSVCSSSSQNGSCCLLELPNNPSPDNYPLDYLTYSIPGTDSDLPNPCVTIRFTLAEINAGSVYYVIVPVSCCCCLCCCHCSYCCCCCCCICCCCYFNEVNCLNILLCKSSQS